MSTKFIPKLGYHEASLKGIQTVNSTMLKRRKDESGLSCSLCSATKSLWLCNTHPHTHMDTNLFLLWDQILLTYELSHFQFISYFPFTRIFCQRTICKLVKKIPGWTLVKGTGKLKAHPVCKVGTNWATK